MRIISITLLLIVASSCNTPEKQVQKNIQNYLNNFLEDPDSYVVESFGNIDTIRDYEYNEELMKISKTLDSAMLTIKMDDK